MGFQRTSREKAWIQQVCLAHLFPEIFGEKGLFAQAGQGQDTGSCKINKNSFDGFNGLEWNRHVFSLPESSDIA
jgi:hypothetical protein